MKKISFLCFVCLAFLTGCESIERPEYGPRDASAPPPIAIRDILAKDESPDDGYGAYGYFLLTKRPTAATRDRFTRAASAFISVLEPIDHAPSMQLMPTYWLLSVGREDAYPVSQDSFLMVDHYDYARAKALLSRIKKTHAEGPVLVAWEHSFETNQGTGDPLVFDLSSFSDQDMERAIGIWTTRITRDPAGWNSGFQLVKMREELRSFLQLYGDQILAIVKTTN